MINMQKKNVILFFIAGIVLFTCASFKPVEMDDEYALKAAFIYRFTDYIEWSNNNDQSKFTIAVLGDSRITIPLLEISSGKKIRGKTMYVKQVASVEDAEDCQVLFVPQDYKGDVENIALKLSGRSVLIITEEKDACRKGAHINFYIDDGKLKFEINLKAAIRSGLKMSSDLLQHATLVDEP